MLEPFSFLLGEQKKGNFVVYTFGEGSALRNTTFGIINWLSVSRNESNHLYYN